MVLFQKRFDGDVRAIVDFCNIFNRMKISDRIAVQRSLWFLHINFTQLM